MCIRDSVDRVLQFFQRIIELQGELVDFVRAPHRRAYREVALFHPRQHCRKPCDRGGEAAREEKAQERTDHHREQERHQDDIEKVR